MRIEICKIRVEDEDVSNTFAWIRLVAGNGRVILTSEMYDSVSNARRAAKSILKAVDRDWNSICWDIIDKTKVNKR